MIFATNNKGKLKEVKEILYKYEIYSLDEKSIFIEVEEDKNSFYENALKKATEIYEVIKEPVIADDSGLCIDILNDWPGVMTHRFLGDNANDSDRNSAILEKMKNYSGNERNAKVICSIVYYDGNNTIVSEGILKGKISIEKRGNNGFGFDEIFELENGKTLAELSSEEKNLNSARYIAVNKLNEKLKVIKNNNSNIPI